MNIPNILTLIRIIMIPLFVIFLLRKEFNFAFIVFITAGLTDALDGFLARILNQKTKVGAILDPIADKLLLSTSYILFAILDSIPNWLSVVVISRDVLIVIGVGVLYILNKEIEFKPSVLSKWTTVFQIITIIAVFIVNIFPEYLFIMDYLFITTAFFTVSSGLHYSYLGLKLMNSK